MPTLTPTPVPTLRPTLYLVMSATPVAYLDVGRGPKNPRTPVRLTPGGQCWIVSAPADVDPSNVVAVNARGVRVDVDCDPAEGRLEIRPSLSASQWATVARDHAAEATRCAVRAEMRARAADADAADAAAAAAAEGWAARARAAAASADRAAEGWAARVACDAADYAAHCAILARDVAGGVR